MVGNVVTDGCAGGVGADGVIPVAAGVVLMLLARLLGDE
jgi:hypothetical protein